MRNNKVGALYRRPKIVRIDDLPVDISAGVVHQGLVEEISAERSHQGAGAEAGAQNEVQRGSGLRSTGAELRVQTGLVGGPDGEAVAGTEGAIVRNRDIDREGIIDGNQSVFHECPGAEPNSAAGRCGQPGADGKRTRRSGGPRVDPIEAEEIVHGRTGVDAVAPEVLADGIEGETTGVGFLRAGRRGRESGQDEERQAAEQSNALHAEDGFPPAARRQQE